MIQKKITIETLNTINFFLNIAENFKIKVLLEPRILRAHQLED